LSDRLHLGNVRANLTAETKKIGFCLLAIDALQQVSLRFTCFVLRQFTVD
jgi:hypothetical protein